jgi:glucosamine-6-phosphate deaminase
MAVPMSPDQVLKKRKAIFYHQSQKDGVMFQGNDTREFWVRAEERNNETAQKYHELGLADYAALEAFKKYNF